MANAIDDKRNILEILKQVPRRFLLDLEQFIFVKKLHLETQSYNVKDLFNLKLTQS